MSGAVCRARECNEVGQHATLCLEAVVGIDEERVDAVAQLLLDAGVLRDEQPPGLAVGRHRVVRAEERDFVQAPVTEPGRVVAAPRPGDVGLVGGGRQRRDSHGSRCDKARDRTRARDADAMTDGGPLMPRGSGPRPAPAP